MSKVIASFKDSLVLLKENTLIVGILFIVGLLSLPVSASRALYGISAFSMASMLLFPIILFLITPYFTGGILGMIKEAQEGKKAGLETFKIEGRKHYFSLIIAYVIFFFIIFGLMFGFGAFVSIIGVLARIGLGLPKPSPIFIFLSMLISMLLAFPIMYFFQFFDVGVVINGYGSLQSFKESFRFVWARKLSVLGFTLLLLLLMIPMMLPGLMLNVTRSTVGSPFAPLPTNMAILYVVSSLFLSTIVGAVMYSYRAVYYIQAKSD